MLLHPSRRVDATGPEVSLDHPIATSSVLMQGEGLELPTRLIRPKVADVHRFAALIAR